MSEELRKSLPGGHRRLGALEHLEVRCAERGGDGLGSGADLLPDGDRSFPEGPSLQGEPLALRLETPKAADPASEQQGRAGVPEVIPAPDLEIPIDVSAALRVRHRVGVPDGKESDRRGVERAASELRGFIGENEDLVFEATDDYRLRFVGERLEGASRLSLVQAAPPAVVLDRSRSVAPQVPARQLDARFVGPDRLEIDVAGPIREPHVAELVALPATLHVGANELGFRTHLGHDEVEPGAQGARVGADAVANLLDSEL